jgi:TolA-binding protein
VLLLLVGTAPCLTRSAELVTYAAMQQSVAAEKHMQTIRDARAFLQRFPESVERVQVTFWLAEALYATQAYQDAAAVYQDLLREAPTFPQTVTVLHHLGLSSLAIRHYRAALSAFAQLLEQFPGVEDREQVVWHVATVYFEQGRFAEALPLYQQLLEAAVPPVAMATLHVQLGHCYLYGQQFTPAQRQYRLVLQDFPTSTEVPLAHYQLGVVALAQQQFEAAQDHFQTMLHTYSPGPATIRAHYAIAWSFYYQGQVERAVTYLRQRNLLAQPSATDAALARGQELVLLRAYHEAIPILTQALTHVHEDEQEQRLRWLLAQAYEGAGNVPQTLQTLDEFMHRFPRSVRAAAVQRWRGDLLLRARDISEALAAYRAALPFAHQDEPAERLLLTMAELHQTQHAIGDAIALWQRLLHAYPLTPRRTEVQLRIGAALVQQGAIAQAVVLYRRLLATDLPQSARVSTQLQLAWAYLKSGEYDEALTMYGELVRTTQDADVLRRARFWRGWVLQRQARYDASNVEWQTLLSLEPPGPRRGEVLWRFGKNLMALEQYQEARDRLLEVVATYATEPYARLATWQLQRCLLELGQPREALWHAPVLVRQEPLAFFKVTERFARGERLFDARQYRQARRIFQQIVAQPIVTPLADDAAFMIAESYFAEGDVRRALHHYRAVTHQFGQTNVTALAYYRTGLILVQAGRLSAAVQALRHAAGQTTNADIRDRAWYHLGQAYMQLQEQNEAVAAFRRLVQEGTKAFATEAERLHIGLLLQQLADYATALQVFQQILQQSADPRIRAETQFWIAETHQLRGETTAALAAYRQVANQFSAQREWALTAMFRAGEIYETLQQYHKAIDMYQRVAAANPHDRQGRYAAERVKLLKAKTAKTPARQG